MARFMKATMAVAMMGMATTAYAAPPNQPVRVPSPIKLPQTFPQTYPQPLPFPQPFPQPAPQWKLGVRISANPAGGLTIHEVFAGSPAELAGLRAGMVLLTVDGVLYNDPLTARDKIMFNSGDYVDLIYADGTGFYQVTAQLSTVTVMMAQTPGGPAVKKVVPQLKNLKKVKVADPRLKR